MTSIRWIDHEEGMVGKDAPDLDDVLNRPLRDVLTASGHNPDTPFTGFISSDALVAQALASAADATAKAAAAEAAAIAHANTIRVGVSDEWGQDPATTDGLDYGYRAGRAFSSAGALGLVAGGTIALTDDATNYVERTLAGVVSANTVGFTTGQLSMAKVVVADGEVASVEDWRHGLRGYFPYRTGEENVVDPSYVWGSVMRHGAVGDGIADDASAIQAATNSVAAAGGGTVSVPRGRYKILSTILGASLIKYVGEPGAVIDISAIPTLVAGMRFEGVRGAAVAVTADALESVSTISVADETPFSVDGWAILYSEAIAVNNGSKRGEIVRIKSLATGQVTVHQRTCDTYRVADTAMLAPIAYLTSPSVEGLRFEGGADALVAHRGIEFVNCINPSVRNCEFKYCHHTGIFARFISGGRISDCHFEESLSTGLGYGITISRASQDVTVVNCTGRKMRHMFTAGTSTDPGEYGMPRRITVTGCSAMECEDAGFDCHNGIEDVAFIGNTVSGTGGKGDSGIMVQASRFTIIGNTVRNVGGHGIRVQQLNNRPMAGVISGNILRRTGLFDSGGGTFSGTGIAVTPNASFRQHNGVVISNNHIEDSYGTSSLSASIAIAHTSTAYKARGFVVTGNIMVQSIESARAILFRGVEDFVCSNNRIRLADGSGQTGIGVQDASDGMLSGNMIHGGGVALSITSVTRVGATVTVTTTEPHTLRVGVTVTVAGANETEYNGAFAIVSVPSDTTFTYTIAGTPATPATGTITATPTVTGSGFNITGTSSSISVLLNRVRGCSIGIQLGSTASSCRIAFNNTANNTTAVSLSTGTGHTFTPADEISADNGNAAKTLTLARDAVLQVWNTPLTADRAVTLSTSQVATGGRFRIVRTAAATGAFNLNVGTGPLKALAAGTWCDVTYTGSAWMLTGYGTL